MSFTSTDLARAQHDARLAPSFADRHEVRPVLLDARLVVHEHEMQGGVGPAGPLALERAACGGLHHLAMPAAVARTGLFERCVRLGDVLRPGAGLTAVAGPDAEPAEHEPDGDEHGEDDQDDRECRDR